MDNTKQSVVSDEPKQAEASNKPEQAKVSDKPEQAKVSDEPVQAKVSDKPEQAKAGDKPKPVNGSDDKPKEAEANDKSSKRKIVKILIYVLLVIAALVLVKYLFFTPPKVRVAQVRQQDFTGEVQGTGTINVDVLAEVGAKIPGRIERVLVDEGDFVRSGQVVATLEDTDIVQVLKRAQARLAAARMTEQAARAAEQSARATVESARATQLARRATEYQTKRAWEREKHLVATGAVSQEEADQYEERNLTAAGALGAAEAEIGAAVAQVAAAGAKVQAAHSEISATEAEVRLQQFNFSQTKIFTYVSGVVTDRPKRSGTAVVSGEAVIKVADPKITVVEVYLDQRFAGKIRAGQTATVILRGRENEKIPGRVYRIRPQADPAAEEMTVEIAFPLPPAELQIGQWADVYVQVSETKNALIVPKTAVMPMGEERVVLVADANNRVRQVKVESLASSPRSEVMAVAGDLKPGNLVLTEPMGIHPGQKVHPTQGAGAADSSSKTKPAMKM